MFTAVNTAFYTADHYKQIKEPVYRIISEQSLFKDSHYNYYTQYTYSTCTFNDTYRVSENSRLITLSILERGSLS